MKSKSSRSSAKKTALSLRNDGNPASLEVFKVYAVISPRKGTVRRASDQ